ncbi:MAG: TonB-dependent receptor [Sphingobacteriia bacterium]|nr:MAG: TonB-dependent receptor [Sphingobacteriia bacterium]
MKKWIKNAFMLSFIAASTAATAQQNADQIVGKLMSDQKPVESVLVSLLKAKDSSIVKTAITDKNGFYSFPKMANGNYLLSASLVGYQKLYSEIFVLNGGNDLVVKNLQIVAAAKELTEVSVNSKKPLIEQKLDRTIVNVEASVTNVGATALEVLEKSPGITVDKDGNISLKGKDGVVVYMDGRPTYLSGPDLANLLRNMQSSQLDQIEIMTNPPARYDAAGNAGIINIKTKKTKIFGFNGSVNIGYGQGIYSRNNQSVNLNYRKNKINVFGNISRNERLGFQDINIARRFIDNNTNKVVSFFEQVNTKKNYNDSYNGKIGVDYFASKNTTIGIVLNGFDNAGTDHSGGDINIFNAQYILANKTIAVSESRDNWKNFSANFNIRRVIDTTGKELSFDADYLTYDGTNNISLNNAYFNTNGQPIAKSDSLLGDLPQQIHIYSAKLDYIHPLKKGAKFEAGLKSSYVTTDANAIYDTLFNGVKMRDFSRSNHFVYKENINAAYANYSRPLSTKWSMQLGVRLEHTAAKGDQRTTNIQFERNYVQVFPTAYFQYTANKSNSFVLNYGRRIRRPDYQSLNPFVEFLDRYTYEQGNPYLKPQFSHNIELSHTFKGFLTTTINYTNTTDIMQQVLIQDDKKNETFIRNENIATQRQYGLSINAFNQYTKWWSGNIYMNVFNNKFDGMISNNPVTLSATTAVINITQQFKFKKGWAAELSGFYRTQGLEGIFNINPFGIINMGFSKQVLKNKGSIRVNVRDILWSQRIKGASKYGNVDVNFQQLNDNRIASISFTYRFSKGKTAASQRKRGGAEDEQSRVGVGSGR